MTLESNTANTSTTSTKSTATTSSCNDNDNVTMNTSNNNNTCPICNSEYQIQDSTYPLLCQTQQCHFNMCVECIQNLLSSTYSTIAKPLSASDGNTYTLNLKCPSCRGDFSIKLEDVLLLRESVSGKYYVNHIHLKEVQDSELSAAQLRLKYDQDKWNDIQGALQRYEHEQQCTTSDAATPSATTRNDNDDHKIDNKDNDDNDNCTSNTINNNNKMEYIDSMLFYGLANSMTMDERIFVKELMTSGSITKIVQATYILASIVDMNRNRGGTPSMRMTIVDNNNNNNNNNIGQLDSIAPGVSPTSTRPSSAPLPTVATTNTSPTTTLRKNNNNHYQPKYRSYQEKINTQRVKSSKAMAATVCMPLSIQSPSELQINTQNRERWKRLYPIPCRMPRAITLKMNFDLYSRWSPLTFMDDEESFLNLRQHVFYDYKNGQNVNKNEIKDVRSNLVRDAFQELKKGFAGKKIIKKDPINSTGVENILATINDDDFQDEAPSIIIPWRRVVVASAKGEVLRSGLRVGDVITHIDGELFDGNTAKLKVLLSQKFYSPDEGDNVCQIVVNAEVGVAEALRIRNVVAKSRSEILE